MYRYTLTRETCLLAPTGGLLGWIMLNPSTADEDNDDPTIRRVMGFTARAGYARMRAVNLYPYRATDPAELRAVPASVRLGDPGLADAAILGLHDCDAIVLAWGSHGAAHPDRVEHVYRLVAGLGRPCLHLGVTEIAGQPRHPLYIAGRTALTRWGAAPPPERPR